MNTTSLFNVHLVDAYCTALLMDHEDEAHIILGLATFPHHLIKEKFAQAITENNTKLMIKLHDEGKIDVNELLESGETFLTHALKNRLHYKGLPFVVIGGGEENTKSVKLETIETLLSFPDLNAGISNARKQAPLSLAITTQDSRPFQLLVDRPDTDVNAANNWGKNILMDLVQLEGGAAVTMLRSLLQRPELDKNAKTDNGVTAAMMLGGNHDPQMIDLFFASGGIELDHVSEHGLSAKRCASGNPYYYRALHANMG